MPMRSTMMDVPLQISRILEHGSTVHASAEVVTWTGAGGRRMTYAEVGATAAQLAHALRNDLGVTGDQRVGTFMWNNAEHLVAYFAVPSMGAVLHTLNIRLTPDQLAYIANHAEARVILVDGTLVPLLARALPGMSTVEHVVLIGDGDPAPLIEASGGRVAVHRWADLLRDKPQRVRLAGVGRAGRRRALLHLRDHRPPQGRGLLAPLHLSALAPGLHAGGLQPRPEGPGAGHRAHVPRHVLGPARTRRSSPARR